ncbi:ribulose-bisphosphate carboxylase large chain [Gammaproteobacteria bacterium]
MALSGERFRVVYGLAGSEAQVRINAQRICLEQTVELPEEGVPAGFIRDEVVGRIEGLEPGLAGFEVTVSYAVETAAAELPQFINLVFGNISILPGIQVLRFDLTPTFFAKFPGPQLGRVGLRELLGVPKRPLLCAALKPMGFSAVQLAEMAYQLALGGIDLIKDDHGLTNQAFAPFEERVQRCADAVARANHQTGEHSLYIPNVTAPFDQIVARAHFAKKAAAGGLLICPALTGLDAMRCLAKDESLRLPILSHPAFQGSYLTSPGNGMSHFSLLGQLTRLAGADAVIFPNYGGRFAFSQAECFSIVAGTETAMDSIKTIFPCPGGGMTLERIPELMEVFGREVIFLMGGGLLGHSPDLRANACYFRELVNSLS